MNKYTGSTLMKARVGFGWRWKHLRICPKCKAQHWILGNNTKMKPELPPGAVVCGVKGCDGLVPLG